MTRTVARVYSGSLLAIISPQAGYIYARKAAHSRRWRFSSISAGRRRRAAGMGAFFSRA